MPARDKQSAATPVKCTTSATAERCQQSVAAVLSTNTITVCLPHAAEQTCSNVRDALNTAANLGFSARQLLQAAVDTLSSAVEGSAPKHESVQERRLRLLVSTALRMLLAGCCAMLAPCKSH